MKEPSQKESFLFVDLDNSLIKTDLLFETFLILFNKNIFAPFIAISILIRFGISGLKGYLYENTNLFVENLPFNSGVLKFIKDWKSKNIGQVFLISASDERLVKKVSEHLGLFDGYSGTLQKNLRSTAKLEKIKSITQKKCFEYVGDSFDDFVIWKHAKHCIAVNPSFFIKKKLTKINSSYEYIFERDNKFIEAFRLIRIHQWAKNLLLFVPLILGGSISLNSVSLMTLGFFSFSFLASAFYILNDLVDIENDRFHQRKRFRPLAKGSISIPESINIFNLLLFLCFSFSFFLPIQFNLVLILYGLSTFFYSKFFKKIALVDIFALAYLYILRILAGSVLLSISISNWLITFSVFFFLFLASIKRRVEIENSSSEKIIGRGYVLSDKFFISQISYFCGLISVLVVCLYIESNQAQSIYSSAQILWFIPLILLFWITEILFKLERGKVDDDPVVYALKSWSSYLVLFVSILILVFTYNS